MSRENLKNFYLDAAKTYKQLEKREDRILLLISLLRLVCFVSGLVLVIFLLLEHTILAGLLTAMVTLVIFLFLLKLYSVNTDKKEFLSNLFSINHNEAAFCDGDLSNFDPGIQYEDSSHDFSRDVDLFGDNSLFRYLNRTVTGYGRDILAGWLTDPHPLASDLAKRQEIIAELAEKVKWRHEFMASGMKVPLERQAISSLVKWMEEEPLIESSRSMKILIYFLPAIALFSMGLLIAGLLHYSVFFIVLVLNLGFVSSVLKRTNKIHSSVAGRYAYLSSMNRLLKMFDSEEFTSLSLNEMKNEISGSGVSAGTAIKKLGRLIQSFDSRLNFIVGIGLNALLLWDFHCIYKLEKWKTENKTRFSLWLDIIGQIDAFSSLGNYAYNNPGFVYPVTSREGIVLSADSLGHPLIDENRRICNDFDLKRQGMICIITGANMAGKSTFLRTVAVNFILAMTGSPVCASRMEFTPSGLFTSMRTTDSLSGNESYFYAELKRLKVLKDKILNDEPVLFILDEILKGTNSADKTLGSKLFLEKLIPLGGTGLIATHDLSLGELEKEHPGNVFNMCFETEIDGESIRFDYRLNFGITRKMNASFLMKQMGILD